MKILSIACSLLLVSSALANIYPNQLYYLPNTDLGKTGDNEFIKVEPQVAVLERREDSTVDGDKDADVDNADKDEADTDDADTDDADTDDADTDDSDVDDDRRHRPPPHHRPPPPHHRPPPPHHRPPPPPHHRPPPPHHRPPPPPHHGRPRPPPHDHW